MCRSEYYVTAMQEELENMRRIGRPKGSRDKTARNKRAFAHHTARGDQHRKMQASNAGDVLADGKEMCDLETKNTTNPSCDGPARNLGENVRSVQNTSWFDCLSFSADSDPFHSDWNHW